jgi:hypothetical protein
MAQTQGLVQRLTVAPGSALACAFIGPTPTNTEVLVVLRENSQSAAEGSFENNLVDILSSAAVSRREVVAFHADNDARITAIRIDPA